MTAHIYYSVKARAQSEQVFVESYDGDYPIPDWELVDIADVGSRNAIRCTEIGCDKPATQMDEFWPYYDDFTLCQVHAEKGAWFEREV